MKTIDYPQGTPEWLQARAGKVTASRINDVMAKIKTGESAARKDYKAQIVAEILTGKPRRTVSPTRLCAGEPTTNPLPVPPTRSPRGPWWTSAA